MWTDMKISELMIKFSNKKFAEYVPDITSTLNCSTDLNHTEGAHRNPYTTTV